MYSEIVERQFLLNQPAITATANSPQWVQDGVLGQACIDIIVSAVSGTTPSLTVQPQVSNDGVNWFNAGPAGAPVTAVSNLRFALEPVRENYMRLAYTVSGTTPSFTVAITVNQA